MIQTNYLSKLFPTKSSKAVFSVLLIALLTLSTFLALYSPPVVEAKSYTALNLSVTPQGSLFKLGVGESKTFTALALNGTAPYIYSWTVSASGNLEISVNGVVKEVLAGKSIVVSGSKLTLLYPKATEEFVSVNVQVKDARGVVASLLQPFVVADPYTSPGYKFDASTATASYIVQADGLGWFRYVKGADGSVVSSLAVSDTIIEAALAACVNKGSVYVGVGTYSSAVVVPTGVTFTLEKGATGVTYSAAGGATCVIADYNSGVFKYYSSGTLASNIDWASANIALTGNVTANNFASTEPMGVYTYMIYPSGSNYMAKAANGTIIDGWTSTNASYTIVSAFNSLTSGRTYKETVLLKGNIIANVLVPSWTKVVIDGQVTSGIIAAGYDQVFETATGAHDVEICGGSINGNATNQIGGSIGVYFGLGGYNNEVHDTNIFSMNDEGSHVGGNGIYSNRNTYLKIYDCNISKTDWDPIFLAETSHSQVTNNFCLGGDADGITLWSTDTSYLVHDNLIVGNHVENYLNAMGQGIYIYTGGQNNTISENFVSNCSTGIKLGNVGGTPAYSANGTLITGNHIISCTSGISTQGTCRDNDIKNNRITSTTNAIVLSDETSINNIVDSNTITNFVTYAYYPYNATNIFGLNNVIDNKQIYTMGVAAGASPFWVTHNLPSTPTIVQITAYDQGGITYSVTGRNSTMFQITHSSGDGEFFYWIAYFQPTEHYP